MSMCRPAGRCIYYIWEDHHIIKSVAPCRPAGSCIILLVVHLQHYFCLFAYIILETIFTYSVLNFVGILLRIKEKRYCSWKLDRINRKEQFSYQNIPTIIFYTPRRTVVSFLCSVKIVLQILWKSFRIFHYTSAFKINTELTLNTKAQRHGRQH